MNVLSNACSKFSKWNNEEILFLIKELRFFIKMILNLTFVECRPGYRGVNCSAICPPGYFGRLCKLQCHCSLDMYCDPTAGCLCNTTSVNCTDPGLSSYLQFKKLSRNLLTRVILKTHRVKQKLSLTCWSSLWY